MKSKAFTVLLALGVIFGSAFLFMKVLVEEISALELVAGRLALGALTIIILLVAFRRAPRLTPSLLGGAALLALFDSVVPYTLIAWAEIRIDAGVASVLISTMPMFTVLFASVVLPDERLAPARFLGLGVGFIGVVSLSGGDVLNVTNGNAVAMIAVVGAAASYGAAGVYARVLLRSEDALSLTGLQLTVAALMMFPLTFAVNGVPHYAALSLEGWLSLLALGILATGIAFAGYFWVVSEAGSVYASLVTYIVPVSGLLLGWAVLGEQIGANTALGAALIALGVAGVMYGPTFASRTQQDTASSTEAQPTTSQPQVLIGEEEFA